MNYIIVFGVNNTANILHSAPKPDYMKVLENNLNFATGALTWLREKTGVLQNFLNSLCLQLLLLYKAAYVYWLDLLAQVYLWGLKPVGLKPWWVIIEHSHNWQLVAQFIELNFPNQHWGYDFFTLMCTQSTMFLHWTPKKWLFSVAGKWTLILSSRTLQPLQQVINIKCKGRSLATGSGRGRMPVWCTGVVLERNALCTHWLSGKVQRRQSADFQTRCCYWR